MEKVFVCRCPYCSHANELYLEDYDAYLESGVELKDVCDLCGNEYSFDLEINISSVVYRD